MESATAPHFGFLPDPIQASQDNGPRVLAHQLVLVRRSRRVAKELAEQRLDGVRQRRCALFGAVRLCSHLSSPSLWSADFEPPRPRPLDDPILLARGPRALASPSPARG